MTTRAGLGRIRHSRLSAKVARLVIRNASRAQAAAFVRHDAVVRLVSRREGTLIVAGFAERDAVARRQSLKGISILALGSHHRWIPRVPAPA